MTRRTVWIGFLGAALALALGVSAAQGSVGDIFGSGHDLGSAGNPACKQCHIPHNAQGDYLWARTPSGSLSGLGSLCFSCHDGSITNTGQWIPSYANHPVTVGVENQDCDRCHDPHEGDNWKFTKDIGGGGSWSNANMCQLCHVTGGNTHPVDVVTNLPIDRIWDPDASPADFSGTRLFNNAGDTVVPSGNAYIKCATCHAPHGGVAGTDLNSMAYSDPGNSQSPICQNCHQ